MDKELREISKIIKTQTKKTDSHKGTLSLDTEAVLILARAILHLAIEIKSNKDSDTEFHLQSLSLVAQELEDFIQLRCSTCSIRDRLSALEEAKT